MPQVNEAEYNSDSCFENDESPNLVGGAVFLKAPDSFCNCLCSSDCQALVNYDFRLFSANKIFVIFPSFALD
jgi:hypothetical protein